MRIKRDYFGAIRQFCGWFISRFKPLAVHTELIMDNDVWKIIKVKCKQGGVKVWHVMTPVNYELYKTSFNIKLSKQRVSEIMKRRYLWMKKELGIVPTEFVPGWWSYNKDTLKICKKYGLKIIYERDYDYTHDYHWVL